MSRTKPRSTGSSNPATKFLQWNTQASAWEFYDKEAQESKTLPQDTGFHHPRPTHHRQGMGR
jgi:hypothetical protein